MSKTGSRVNITKTNAHGDPTHFWTEGKAHMDIERQWQALHDHGLTDFVWLNTLGDRGDAVVPMTDPAILSDEQVHALTARRWDGLYVGMVPQGGDRYFDIRRDDHLALFSKNARFARDVLRCPTIGLDLTGPPSLDETDHVARYEINPSDTGINPQVVLRALSSRTFLRVAAEAVLRDEAGDPLEASSRTMVCLANFYKNNYRPSFDAISDLHVWMQGGDVQEYKDLCKTLWERGHRTIGTADSVYMDAMAEAREEYGA